MPYMLMSWGLWSPKRSNQGRRLSGSRSEEHTSELQSQSNLVCRLLLEKKKLSQIRPALACFPLTATTRIPNASSQNSALETPLISMTAGAALSDGLPASETARI